MRSHRRSALAVTTFVALGILGPAAQAAAAPPPEPAPPVVTVGEVKCRDLSGLVEAVPVVAEFVDHASTVSSVRVDIRPPREMRTMSYSIHVNDQQRSAGNLNGGAHASADVLVPNEQPAHVVVRTNDAVAVDRTVTARC